MMDYDEGLEKKERLRLIIGKTVIITPVLCTFIIIIGSIIDVVLADVVLADVGRVIIEDIRNDDVYNKMGSSTYAVIKNNGFTAVNLEGWRLNAGNPGQDFYFPSFILKPGRSCRVYTNEIHIAFGGFSFGIGRAIWDFSDCGYLYDNHGVLVDEYCY
jgi:hypothetical protein